MLSGNQASETVRYLEWVILGVFYNGIDEKEDEVILCLSDAFKEEIRQNVMRRHYQNSKALDNSSISDEVECIFREANPDIEVKVRMLNINHGHNKKILSACKPLGEFAWFVAQVRKNIAAFQNAAIDKNLGIEAAIDQAIDEMPDDFEIKKFITANRAEVKDMCLTEYNETETMELFRREGRQEGRQEGRREGWREGRQEGWLLSISNLMKTTGLNAEKAMDLLMIPQNQRNTLYDELSKNV